MSFKHTAHCRDRQISSTDKNKYFLVSTFFQSACQKFQLCFSKVCPTYCPMMNGGMNHFLKGENFWETNDNYFLITAFVNHATFNYYHG